LCYVDWFEDFLTKGLNGKSTGKSVAGKSVTGRAADATAPLVNENIKVPRVRLIAADGESVGIVPIEDALDAAMAEGLDLVVVAENSDPPVCKVMDYGKHRYEQQKKKTDSRKKQKIVSIKEIQLRPFIGDNDLLIKCKAIKKFIENDDKVKVILRYRGREISHHEIGWEVIKKVQEFSQEFAKEESSPKLEGSVITMVLCRK
jgi:translation initiation factor IF-3